MARLLTVVNERKRLRSEYRKILENEYIDLKKKEENEKIRAEVKELRAKGVATPKLPEEIWAEARKDHKDKVKSIEHTLVELKKEHKSSEKRTYLEDKDL